MDTRIQDLDGTAAVQILRNVARKWIEFRGVEAFIVIDDIRRKYRDSYENLPSWINKPADTASDELITLSKLALNAILDGEQSEARDWVEAELADVQLARAQVVDPLTLTIVGATIIGIILASRVKKLGNTEFYEGVPKETVDLVKHAVSISVPVNK